MIAMLLSGGPDSTVLAHQLVAEGERPLALTMNLGDREAPKTWSGRPWSLVSSASRPR